MCVYDFVTFTCLLARSSTRLLPTGHFLRSIDVRQWKVILCGIFGSFNREILPSNVSFSYLFFDK